MAAKGFVKYQGETFGKNFKPKFHNLATKIDNAKTFTELQAVLAHNRLSKLDLFVDDFCSPFRIFHKGKISGALGAGIRFIEAGGTLPVSHYEDPQADSKQCLVVPNNTNDRDEILKAVIQLDCSGRMPHYLWGSDLFIQPEQQKQFQDDKIGDIRASIALQYGLLWNYILAIDPWGEKSDHSDNFSDYLQNFGVGSLLGFQVEQDNDPIAKTLKKSFELADVKKEIDKERKLANKYVYHVNQWMIREISNSEQQAIKVYKSPTAELDSAKFKKLYVDNATCSPLENMGALAHCLLTKIQEMLRPSARNSSKFPGNHKDSLVGWGATKDKFHYISRTTKDRLVVIMNVYLLEQLRSMSSSKYTDNVVNYQKIENLLSYNIIGIESIPYGCIKIVDKDRYNEYTLVDYEDEDALNQKRLRIYNYHRDIVFGIREFPCACVMRIVGLYMNPSVWEAAGEFGTLTDL